MQRIESTAPVLEPTAAGDEDAAKLARFMDWFQQNGGRAPALEVRMHNGLRGLYARRDIERSECLVYVPRALVVTPWVTRFSHFGRCLQQADVTLTDDGHMSLFLIEMRRRQGFWAPWIDLLPASFDHLPLCFDAHDWSLLKGTFATTLARYMQRWIKEDYRQVRRVLPPEERITLREFTWGWLCASTRKFALMVDGKPTVGMVPMADMMNHRSGGPARWSGDHSTSFDLNASADIRSGDQVMGSYGSLRSAALMAHYGFAIEDNAEELVRVRFRLPPQHFALAVANEGEDLASQVFDIGATFANPGMRRMFSLLRMASLPDMQTCRRVVPPDHGSKWLPPISLDNERRALLWLLEVMNERLPWFSETVQDDDKLLAQGGLTPRQRCAVLVRRGEKRLVHRWMDMARDTLQVLMLDTVQRDETLARLAEPGQPFADYYAELLTCFAAQDATQEAAAVA